MPANDAFRSDSLGCLSARCRHERSSRTRKKREQEAIVAAAADELRSSSGSADGSPAPEAKPSPRGKGDKHTPDKPDEKPRAEGKKRKKERC